MTTFDPGIIANIGVAGFAIWIMWRMYESSQRRFKEKDEDYKRL